MRFASISDNRNVDEATTLWFLCILKYTFNLNITRLWAAFSEAERKRETTRHWSKFVDFAECSHNQIAGRPLLSSPPFPVSHSDRTIVRNCDRKTGCCGADTLDAITCVDTPPINVEPHHRDVWNINRIEQSRAEQRALVFWGISWQIFTQNKQTVHHNRRKHRNKKKKNKTRFINYVVVLNFARVFCTYTCRTHRQTSLQTGCNAILFKTSGFPYIVGVQTDLLNDIVFVLD